MQRSGDFTPREWIWKGKADSAPRDLGSAWPGVPVGNLVPAIFPSYAKVFHAINYEPTRGEYSRSKRISWRELAQQSGIDFHPEISEGSFAVAFAERGWPQYLIGPGEGRLDEESCRALGEILDPFTLRQPCWFYYSGLSIRDCQPRLYSGNLKDVISLPEEEGVSAMPEYWWPQDRSWLICSDFDLSFTLVGGPAELIRLCLANRGLEALAITPATRVDVFADVRNARKSIRRFAERFLSGEMSVIVAARAISRIRHCLGEEFAEFLKPWAQADGAFSGVPIGAVRNLWSPEALVSQDAKARKIELLYLDSVRKACLDFLNN